MSNASAVKEPLVRIVKRDSCTVKKSILVYFLGVFGGLVAAAAVIMLITKLNPLEVYATMFKATFDFEAFAKKDFSKLWYFLRDMCLLLCISIGLAPAFKMRFWNIGAEGQVLVGGLVSACCMIYLSNLPTTLLLIVMAVVSMAAGALWGLIPAFFKSKFGTNETLFTLMMNYIAIQMVEVAVDIFDKKQSHSVGIINYEKEQGWMPALFNQEYLMNLIIAAILMVAVFVYLKYTKHGYEISVVGESTNTARYAGISVRRVILRTMLISGAICGLAGFVEVSAISHTISKSTAGGRGFTAIIVAWLGKFNTFVMALIAMLLVFLDKGATAISSEFHLNDFFAQMITGVILFFILGCEFFIHYRLVFRKANGVEKKGA